MTPGQKAGMLSPAQWRNTGEVLSMINLIPEPKKITETGGRTIPFAEMRLCSPDTALGEIFMLRIGSGRGIRVTSGMNGCGYKVCLETGLDGIPCDNPRLLVAQGYSLSIGIEGAVIRYETRAGFINAVTTLKCLLAREESGCSLPLCLIEDWPSLDVRAVAPTFSWYAGYGRVGFDSQLWGLEEWMEFIDACLDSKINQLNMVMYGYWPFEMEDYPETVLRNVPLKIWNAENHRWLTVCYTHPNLEEPYLNKLITYAHRMEVKIFAYVGLNSYNGAYSIKHPEARTKPPASSRFLNDFDSLCLSWPGTETYILRSMARIAEIGFDGFTLEESEEGFWYCECEDCRRRWYKGMASPVEAKHKANLWLLNRIYQTVRAINPRVVIGIRAFRQPPLEKDPAFLAESVRSIPEDIMLFWAPGLYVPEAEFDKWIAAFDADRIWGRDTEANAITSTMGRLYRTFKNNLLRYSDEPCEQTIETDIRQHMGSVSRGVHGINGFMFEWYGLFMHLFAHGNYGWGSTMDPEVFYARACDSAFGTMGKKVLYILQNILTVHESQMPFYTTPFPFQKNRVEERDIPAILAAKEAQPRLLKLLGEVCAACAADDSLRVWLPHFNKIMNALRRNAVIYDMALSSLRFQTETDPRAREELLDEILRLNEEDFAIAKEMFFDLNPISETGVKSCMFPYHEIKRLIYNIRHPEAPDNDIICSGIEALGWLWL
jgi:hypothetical protein